MLRPRVPALEAEVARLQVEVQDRNKGLREAQTEESLARAQVSANQPAPNEAPYCNLVVRTQLPGRCQAMIVSGASSIYAAQIDPH